MLPFDRARASLDSHPDDPLAWAHYAKACHDALLLDEADEAFGRAAELSADPARFLYDRGMINLLQGKFAKGWARYENRLHVPEFKHRRLPKPRWEGEPLAGTRLLVIIEQGIGDVLQFLRFVPRLREQGARLLVECPAEFRPLLGDLLADDEVFPVAADTIDPRLYDWYVSLLSIPLQLRLFSEGDYAMRAPYLRVPAREAEEWRARLAEVPGRRVGIVWAGRPTHPQDAERSCDPRLFRALAEVPGVSLVSLQLQQEKWPLAAEERGFIRFEAAPFLTSWSATAGLLAALDLLVSVDTSVVHLAGALGRPVRLLVPRAPDFRWLLGRTDSPWYPSIQLDRQDSPGDWAGTFSRVAAELSRGAT